MLFELRKNSRRHLPEGLEVHGVPTVRREIEVRVGAVFLERERAVGSPLTALVPRQRVVHVCVSERQTDAGGANPRPGIARPHGRGLFIQGQRLPRGFRKGVIVLRKMIRPLKSILKSSAFSGRTHHREGDQTT